jgi:hypothetical protein
MNPFLIRMLLRSRRSEGRPPGAPPPGLGRVYAFALGLIVLLILVILIVEASRTHGGNPP